MGSTLTPARTLVLAFSSLGSPVLTGPSQHLAPAPQTHTFAPVAPDNGLTGLIDAGISSYAYLNFTSVLSRASADDLANASFVYR